MLAVGASVAHAQDGKAYQTCLSTESLAMIERQIKAGVKIGVIDPRAVGKEVYDLCRARHLQGMKDARFYWDLLHAQTVAMDKHNGLWRAENERLLRERAQGEAKEREENAPKLKAEGEAANARYRECLYGHARLLALNTNESAEIVTRATFASCRAERNGIVEVHARYKDYWFFKEDTLVHADKLFNEQVLLEVVKQRALPRNAPDKPPTAPKSDRDT
jgi:hypothetical protein